MSRLPIKFGTDGWRAVIGKDFTFENVKILSQAVADYLKLTNKGRISRVMVGYDVRFLSREFAYAVASVLAANKIKVAISAKAVSTPVVSFTTKQAGMNLGIMITASHNPYYFNGFKIKNPQGGAADNNVTNAVEKLLLKSKVKYIKSTEARKRGLLKVIDAQGAYIKFIRGYIHTSSIKKLKIKVLIDLMYGSADTYIERILKGSSIKFSYLHKEFNPSFGGKNPEPTKENLDELIAKMRAKKFDLGIAIDGDGDRIACILKSGRYIDAQKLLPLLALHLAGNRKLSGGIVKTIVGSNLIDSVAMRLKRILYETPVGFKHISNLFQTEDILIGGEEAGGIGVKNYIPERDATMVAVLLLEMISLFKGSPKELIDSFEKQFGKWFYLRTSVSVKKIRKAALDKLKIPFNLLGRRVTRVNRLDGIKIITDKSWLMFRASGTEPIVRIYAEARTERETKKLIDKGRQILNAL